MAIDEGRKRVGIAVTDESGEIAFPYKTVDKNIAIREILSVIRERDVKTIIIGLPFNTDGSRGFRYEEVTNFARAIKNRADVELYGIDERYSTEEAKDVLESYPGKKTFDIDAIEAFVILKRFLNNEKTYPV